VQPMFLDGVTKTIWPSLSGMKLRSAAWAGKADARDSAEAKPSVTNAAMRMTIPHIPTISGA
jgi:hypothetical protein